MSGDKRYVTKEEAIKEGLVTRYALRCLIRDGILKRYRKPGDRCVLIDRDELAEAMKPKEISV